MLILSFSWTCGAAAFCRKLQISAPGKRGRPRRGSSIFDQNSVKVPFSLRIRSKFLGLIQLFQRYKAYPHREAKVRIRPSGQGCKGKIWLRSVNPSDPISVRPNGPCTCPAPEHCCRTLQEIADGRSPAESYAGFSKESRWTTR